MTILLATDNKLTFFSSDRSLNMFFMHLTVLEVHTFVPLHIEKETFQVSPNL